MSEPHSQLVTLQSHALQQQSRFPDAGGTLAWILSALSISTKIIANTTEPTKVDADALVLSGGAPSIGTEIEKLGNCGRFIDELDIPVYGICVGAQYLAVHFGGKAHAATRGGEFGKAHLVVDQANGLFEGLPKEFVVWQSHNDEIHDLPEVFDSLAHSEHCTHQAIAHKKPKGMTEEDEG